MGINWKVRIKNPLFWVQIFLSIMTPILAYAGLTASDITTWNTFAELFVMAIKNPYVLGLVLVSVWNAVNDPTTEGAFDSKRALEYEVPYADK